MNRLMERSLVAIMLVLSALLLALAVYIVISH